MSMLTGTTKKKARKKKPDELLSSVVRETAVSAAVELLRVNEPFAFPSGTAWVILTLQADAIGGLSRKHGRDEAKGSIIRLIEDDSIATVATKDMLAEEAFGIIPDASTLERMEEYSLLTGAEYAWGVAYQPTPSELRVELVAPATYQQAVAISRGNQSLREAVGPDAWKRHSGEAAVDDGFDESVIDADTRQIAPVQDEAAAVAPATEDEGDPLFDKDPAASAASASSPDAADEPEFEEGPTDQEPEFEEDLEPEFDQSDAPSAPAGEVLDDPEDEDKEDWIGQVETDEDATDDQVVVDEEQVRASIARRFLSEDLDLEVGLEDLDASFSLGYPAVEIQAPADASDWLAGQVAQLVHQANAELAQLHESGEAALRAEYVNLMSLHAEQVIREVSIDRDGSPYKGLVEAAKADHADREGGKSAQIEKRKKEISEAFNEAVEQIGEQAATQAKVQYRERNKGRVQREQSDVVAEIEAGIENAFSHTQQEILRVRRRDAELKMELGKSRVFEVITERLRENQEAEAALLAERSAQIQRVIDENRKGDLSRAEALAEEQARTDRISALRSEHDEAIDRLRSEHAQRLNRMEEELERSRTSALEQQKSRDAEWQHALDLEKQKTDAQSSRVADLLSQMEKQGETFKRQYEDRVNDLEAARRAQADDLERVNAIQSRWNTMTVTLMVVIGVLMFVAGIIGGITLF